MAILNHGSTIRTADGGQTTTTIVTASNIGSYAVASSATYYIGTTQNVFNRASGAQTLTGVSIDGNAATVTNGVYTTGEQTIAGAKTFNSAASFSANAFLTGSSELFIGSYMSLQSSSTIMGMVGFNRKVSDGTIFNSSYAAYQLHNNTGTLNLQVYSSAGGFVGAHTFNSSGNVTFLGTVSAATDFRAPIFYDSNNTAYYIDPASTSIVNSFKVYDALYFGDYTTYLSQATPYLRITTANGYGNFGPANSSWFHMTTDRPNFYMAVGLHVNGDIFVYNTQSQLTSTSVRAPIFYDSGNTSYYLDPANSGTSLLVAGNVGVGTTSASSRLHSVAPLAYSSAVVLRLDGGPVGFSGANDADTAYSIMFDGCAYKLSTSVVQRNGAEIQMLKFGSWNEAAGGVGTKGSLVFKTNNGTIDTPDLSERMRIRYDGNVGIGTTSPRVLLDLAKANNVAQVLLLGETSANIRVGFGLNPSNAGMRIFSYNHISDGLIEFGGISSDGSTWTRNHRLGLAGGNSFFNEQGGNVGIGTTSPGYKLDITGDARIASAAGAGALYFGTLDTSNIYLKLDNNYDLSLVQNASSGNGLYLAGAGNVYVSIDSNNNGTTDAFIVQNNAIKAGTELFRVQENGVVTASTDFRAPIFYDSNDTGYYINPNGTSSLVNVIATEFYARNWFRNDDSGEGIYNQTTTQHFYSDDVSYWNVASSSGAQGIRFRTGGYAGTVRGYVYANDSNDVGLLNNGGNWRARVVGGDYFLADGSSIRGQIFYDSNDTNYYCDPNGSSVLASVTANAYYPRAGVTESDIYAQSLVINAYHHGDSLTYDTFQFNGASVYETKATSGSSFVSASVDTSIFKGDRFGGMTIANGVYQARWTWNNTIGYKFFKSLYIANSTNGNSFTVTIETSGNGTTWTTVATTGSMSNWPGHSWYNYAWNNNATQGYIRITVTPTWANANTINIYNMRYFCSYNLDAGSRLYDWDYSKNVTFLVSAAAPIFYDSDNTSYYINAASASSLNTLTMAGIITTVSSGTAINFSGQSDSFGYNATAGQGTYIKGTGATYIYGGGVFYDGSAIRTLLHSNNYSGYSAFSGAVSGTSFSGTSVNIAGNSASADPYGTIAVTEPAGASNYSYYGLTRQANIGTGFGLTGTTGALGLGANAFWFGTSTSTAAGVMGSAYIAFNGSSFVTVGTVDGTQFRDRDDTTYYLDPASTTLSLKTRSSVVITNANAPENLAMLNIGYSGSGETRAIDIKGGWSANESKSITFNHATGSANIVAQINAQHNGPGSRLRWGKLYHSGDSSTYTMELISESTTSAYLTVAGSVRSPIFYDSGDTNYYLDPAGTSRLNTTRIGNINVGSGTYLNTITPIGDTNINLSAPSGAFYFDTFPRMPGFYDSADTTYYIDPAGSTSINVNGYIISSGTGGNKGAILGNLQVGYAGTYNTVQTPTNADTIWLQYSHSGNVGLAYGGGYTTAYNSIRSPIFYDSDNTAYYANPAGTSVFNELVFGSNITIRKNNDRNLEVQGGGGPDSGIVGKGSSGQFAFQVYGSGSGSYGFLDGVWAGWDIRKVVDGDLFLNDNNSYYLNPASTSLFNATRHNSVVAGSTSAMTSAGALAIYSASSPYISFHDGGAARTAYMQEAGGRFYFGEVTYTESEGSFRSPLFYDVNDTNYYIDPASTSILNTIRFAGKLTNNGSVSDDDGFGIYWDNSESTAYAIYREAGSWTSPYPDLRIAFHTGIKLGANAGYNGIRFYNDYDMATQVMSVNNSGDGLGANNVYVNNALQAGGSLRAPIFYDSNDTTYYLDPNNTGTSLLVAGSVGIGTTSPAYKLQVNGSFAATTKSFDIPHPTKENKRLVYASLEGPENGVYVRGKNKCSTIYLPDYWTGLVYEDSITVSITPIGKTKQNKIRNYSVTNIEDNMIQIFTDSEDEVYDFNYIVYAERKDVAKLVVEKENE